MQDNVPWGVPVGVVMLALVVVGAAFILLVPSDDGPPMWLDPIKIRRENLKQHVAMPSLDKLLPLDKQDLLLTGGYGIAAECVAPVGDRDAVLRSITLMKFDPDPALEMRRPVFTEAGKRFADAVTACNAVRNERVFLLLDRTRPGIDDEIRKQVVGVVINSTLIDEALARRNGMELAIHSLTGSVFNHDPRLVSVTPLLDGQAAGAHLEAAKAHVESALQSSLARRMGEDGSALATTIANVLTRGKPSAGDTVIVVSDYLENDSNTIQVTRAHLSESGEFPSPEVRAEVKNRLQHVLSIPALAGVVVRLHLLPVPSELPRMMAMARIFKELLEEKEAHVTIHID